MLVRMKGGGNDENPHAKQTGRMTLREHRIVGPAAHHDGVELPEQCIEINGWILNDPVVFPLRPRDEAVQAHSHTET